MEVTKNYRTELIAFNQLHMQDNAFEHVKKTFNNMMYTLREVN